MVNHANIAPKITALKIWCDGGSRNNPGPGACAFVVKDEDCKTLFSEGKLLGKVTNNIAEYNGVILALIYLKNNYETYNNYNFYLDSNLVVSQLNGLFKIKDSKLRDLFLQIKILENEIKIPVKYNLIPREQNREADLLVNQTLDKNL